MATGDVKQRFNTLFSFTITNANIATSATAGWKSNLRDNSSNLFEDCLVRVRLAAVNTAPANSKALFIYASAEIHDSNTNFTSTGDGQIDGSEGTVTFPDVTTLAIPLPLLGVVPYPVQNKAIVSAPFSVARCFGGVLPPQWCIAWINHTGMTLSVTAVEGREVYRNVSA